jgi:hypothetical protein
MSGHQVDFSHPWYYLFRLRYLSPHPSTSASPEALVSPMPNVFVYSDAVLALTIEVAFALLDLPFPYLMSP